MKKSLRITLLVLTISLFLTNATYGLAFKEPLAGQQGKTFRNSHQEENFIEISLASGQKLHIKGVNNRGFDSFMVDILNEKSDKLLARDQGQIKNGSFIFEKEYNLGDSNYLINIYYGNKKVNDKSWSIRYILELETSLNSSNGQFNFPKTEVYQKNIQEFLKNPQPRKEDISLGAFTSEEQVYLKNLVDKIVGPEKDPYKKAYLISNWIADNIYYDYDALRGKTKTATKTMETLKTRRSICQGYANLTQALMRAGGLPTRSRIGYGLGGSGIEGESWENVEEGKSNHVWNEIYVKGRWIIVDNTWNSTNRYENGRFTKIDPLSSHFDMTLEGLSNKHKISTSKE